MTKRRRTDNTMTKRRRTDNTMTKRRRTDNTMTKRRRTSVLFIINPEEDIKTCLPVYILYTLLYYVYTRTYIYIMNTVNRAQHTRNVTAIPTVKSQKPTNAIAIPVVKSQKPTKCDICKHRHLSIMEILFFPDLPT
jgi:hypothetical protein